MKFIKLSGLVIGLTVLFSSCAIFRHTPKPVQVSDDALKENYAKVQDVLQAIIYAVEEAYVTDPGYSSKPPKDDPENALNHLTEVSIELSNSLSKKVDGEVSFFVKIGGTNTKEKASKFSYTFEPIKNEANAKTALAKVVDTAEKKAVVGARSKALRDALISLGTCLKKYKNSQYSLNKLELEVTFKLTKSATGGVEFEIGPVGINGSGELEWGNENVITLTFDLAPKK